MSACSSPERLRLILVSLLLIASGPGAPALAHSGPRGRCNALLDRIQESSPIRIPRTAKYLERVDLGRIRERPAFNPEEIRIEKKHFLDNVHGIRKGMHRAFPGSKSVKTVFYPLAGSDLALPFLLFPQAETVFVLDIHALWDSEDLGGEPELVFEPFINGSVHLERMWRSHTDLNIDEYTAPRGLGSLRAKLPGFRLRRMDLFSTREQLFGEGKKYLGPGGHGILEFDTGPRTPVRSIVHIQAFLDPEMDLTKQWWHRELRGLNPQAVIVKAAMGHLNPHEKQSTPQMRDQIVEMLQESGGYLVEGNGQGGSAGFSHGWEFSGRSDGLPGAESTTVIKDATLSYAEGALITRFAKPGRGTAR